MTGPARVPRAAEWIAENDTLVSRRGHRIAFRRRGTGPTILLLHGFPTWSYDYAEVATDLAADHNVITMDFLGYGAQRALDAGVPVDRIVNTWPVDKLLAWTQQN